MQPLRVMTFNTRGFRPFDGINFWPERAGLNVETIKRYIPDVLGFQECQRGNLLTYLAELTEYQFVVGHPSGVSTQSDDLKLNNPLFWRAERFDLLSTGSFWLSETPDTWSKDWESNEVRSANWVKLTDKQTNTSWVFLNTHYDHVSFPAHVGSTHLILRKVDELSEGSRLPVVIMGDFNSDAHLSTQTNPHPDISYQLYLEDGFSDSFIEAGNSDNAQAFTYHEFKGDNYISAGDHMDKRIDWILTRGGNTPVHTTFSTIIRDAAPPLYPSDHYPMLSELVVDEA